MSIVLVVNPASDREFARLARASLEGVTSPGALEAALRAAYPRCVVRPRLISNERFVVWYVYREGHWVPRDPVEEG